MDLQDDDEDLTGMDINMVFTLLVQFRGAKEEVAHMCLNPKQAMFEKPEESSST